MPDELTYNAAADSKQESVAVVITPESLAGMEMVLRQCQKCEGAGYLVWTSTIYTSTVHYSSCPRCHWQGYVLPNRAQVTQLLAYVRRLEADLAEASSVARQLAREVEDPERIAPVLADWLKAHPSVTEIG